MPLNYESEEGAESDREEQILQLAADEAIDSQAILKKGSLSKRSGKLKVWKRKWFVLRTTVLACYRDEKEYKLNHLIKLNTIRAISEVPKKSRENVIGIITTDKVYYLQAETPTEMHDWIEEIRLAKENLPRRMPQGDPLAVFPAPPGRLNRAHTMANPRKVSQEEPISPIEALGTTVPVRPHLKFATSTGSSPPLASPTPPSAPPTPITTLPEPRAIPIRPTHLTLNRAHTINPTPRVGSHQTDASDPGFPAWSPDGPASPGILHSPFPEHSDGGAEPSSDDETEEHNWDPVVRERLNSTEVLQKGYLLKRDKYKHWRRRWFVLRAKSLSYYRNNKESRVPRIIALDEIKGVRLPSPDSSKSKRPAFCLEGNKRDYWLCAETREQADDWIRMLQEHLVINKRSP
ncbi:hypothetical protein H4R33_003371 [Dimargaris cristalligena]|uniref:PH domain-containing protein n=1 Tax=Dimargaris cristalligena TaxID=215637 RepID=A0A4P9ZTJ5_9FUNG|nr:hypothetical protein H4R33_003371 [Dimargaris cristalligena]RKP36161.1 hypothetical protein BJ085DRAFT_35858 [Dimargaris cristalligena]|eukprot:RKP36161.1 hypothetical protein BJ085DRAFT_35858 [Dimargaris cristalligena]